MEKGAPTSRSLKAGKGKSVNSNDHLYLSRCEQKKFPGYVVRTTEIASEDSKTILSSPLNHQQGSHVGQGASGNAYGFKAILSWIVLIRVELW